MPSCVKDSLPMMVTLEQLQAHAVGRSAPPWQSLIGVYRLSVSPSLPATAPPLVWPDEVYIPHALDRLRRQPWGTPRIPDEEYAAMLAWLRLRGRQVICADEE